MNLFALAWSGEQKVQIDPCLYHLVEHARHGVRVNAVAPTVVKTPMVMAVPEDVRKGWMQTVPLEREAEPSEISSAITLLLSDYASYIKGQIVGNNGGSVI